MQEHQSVREVRLEKLERIKKMGIIPYSDKCKRDMLIHDLLTDFEKKIGNKITVAGRVMARREHGKAMFLDLKDDSASIQLHVAKDKIGENEFEFLSDLIDIGDFIEVAGECFVTRRGENSLDLNNFKLLSKSILPLPEKWQGLKDQEKKYRYRYLDFIMDDALRDRFRLRSKVINAMRDFMNDRNFIEVETPILQATAGGALAKPFMTHYNAFDCDVKLRISPELYLKRLIAGGYEKVYEIAKVFRNEGRDPSHLQEFTMFEFYNAYASYEDVMLLTEEMIKEVLTKTIGNLNIKIGDLKIDMTPPYPRMNIFEIIKKYGGVDLSMCQNADDLRDYIVKTRLEIDGDYKTLGYGKLLDEIYKKLARPHVAGPIFLIDHPIELSPLARKKDSDPTKVDRFQLIVNGWEICNAYQELVDPLDQQSRFEEQAKLKDSGDEEAHAIDSDYVETMSHGMPPITGWGMGIDRFMSLVTGIDNLRDLVLFPFVKVKEENEQTEDDGMIVKDVTNDPEVKLSKNLINDLPETEATIEGISDEELEKLNNETMGISREEAIALMKANLNNANLQKHSLTVASILKEMAKKIGADEEVWEIAGLLHDIDYEKTMDQPAMHCLLTENILKEQNVSPLIIQAIKAHNPACGGKIITRLDKAIYCADPLAGFLVACALVTPDKKISSVATESAVKKYAQKAFAKGANRDIIQTCNTLGLSVEEFIALGLGAVKGIAGEIGL